MNLIQFNFIKKLAEKLEKKFLNGYRGCFGTTSKRVRSVTTEYQNPGPGEYNPVKLGRDSFISNKGSLGLSKREGNIINNENPGVGEYDSMNFDIASKNFKEVIDHVVRNHPGFNATSTRFKEQELIVEEHDNLNEKIQITADEFKKIFPNKVSKSKISENFSINSVY